MKLLNLFAFWILICIILSLFCCEASAQTLPVKWKQTGTWNGFEIVVNQDAANVLLSITNTTLKKSIPKTSFSKLTVFYEDTVQLQNLRISLAQTVGERDLALLERDMAQRENMDLQRQMASLINQVKLIRAEMEKDTVITIRFPKSAFKQ